MMRYYLDMLDRLEQALYWMGVFISAPHVSGKEAERVLYDYKKYFRTCLLRTTQLVQEQDNAVYAKHWEQRRLQLLEMFNTAAS